jgi:hypothetical protein
MAFAAGMEKEVRGRAVEALLLFGAFLLDVRAEILLDEARTCATMRRRLNDPAGVGASNGGNGDALTAEEGMKEMSEKFPADGQRSLRCAVSSLNLSTHSI